MAWPPGWRPSTPAPSATPRTSTSRCAAPTWKPPKTALAPAGFIYYELQGIPTFLDGSTGGRRDAVHVIIANEKARSADAVPAPDVLDAARPENFQIASLEALLRMKLTAFRLHDRVHILDMLAIGLIDATWKSRLPDDLAARLQTLIDTPEG
jgi:hypothetical protein